MLLTAVAFAGALLQSQFVNVTVTPDGEAEVLRINRGIWEIADKLPSFTVDVPVGTTNIRTGVAPHQGDTFKARWFEAFLSSDNHVYGIAYLINPIDKKLDLGDSFMLRDREEGLRVAEGPMIYSQEGGFSGRLERLDHIPRSSPETTNGYLLVLKNEQGDRIVGGLASSKNDLKQADVDILVRITRSVKIKK